MQASTGVGALAGEEIPPATGASAVSRWIFEVWQGYQHLLDKWNPKGRNRWIASSVIAILYVLRVVYIQGFHIISYALGIYLLCLLMEFVSPLVDPEAESHEGPTLPTRNSDEFRPFVRRLPEFKFWYSFTTAFCIAFVLTFFGIFDVPVYWPILLGYWMFMLIHMMRSQILHMMKHKYIPFSSGKQTYSKKKSPSVGSESLLP